jgi:hypothetical protein
MAEAGDIPPFAFIWQPKASSSDGDDHGTLLAWPLHERRPVGAFARFIEIEAEDGQGGIVVPMDLDAAAPRPTGAQEELGDLPLLIRLPFADPFTLRVRYLVRQDGRTQVGEMAEPSVRFRAKAAKAQLMLIGLVRGDKSASPDRPVVVPTVEHAIDEATQSIEPSKHIELADIVFDAYERSGGTRPGIGSAFVLAVPHQDYKTIGPAKKIFPYSGARIPASMEFLLADESNGDIADGCPRLSLRVGTSHANQRELKRSICFFHWNRSAALARNQDGGSPVILHQGELQEDRLCYTFREAAFGDVVGVMTGFAEALKPDFPDWPDHDKFFQTSADWITVPFVCTGDEMIALNYYIHAETNRVIDAVKHDLNEILDRLPPPQSQDPAAALADYLLGSSPTVSPAVVRLTKRAIQNNSGRDVAALDCYGELLRELDRQLRAEDEVGQWQRLESLFSFAVFEKAPELLRALVVSRELRQAVPSDFEDHRKDLDSNVLVLAMRAVGLSDLTGLPVWLCALDTAAISVTWELLRRDRRLAGEIIAMGVLPDLELMSDWFDGRAEPTLRAYSATTPDQLSAAASDCRASGRRADADLLEAAHKHRSSRERDHRPLPYARISAIVELLRHMLTLP